jgi:hypothetical protein
MSSKFDPYDLNAFLQTIIVFVLLLGFIAATAAIKAHGV